MSISAAFRAFQPGGRNVPKGMTADDAYALAQKTNPHFPCPDFDPMKDLRALNVPGLWVLGGNDWIVPSQSTIHNLEVLRRSSKPYAYRRVAGAGHTMAGFGTSRMVEEAVGSWLERVVANTAGTKRRGIVTTK